jgi:hypothetical protein
MKPIAAQDGCPKNRESDVRMNPGAAGDVQGTEVRDQISEIRRPDHADQEGWHIETI